MLFACQDKARPSRQLKGMTRCKDNCLICPYMLETKKMKHKNGVWKIEANVNCQTYNIVYMLICSKERCIQKDNIQMKYIGESERTLKERVCEHIGYVNTKKLK